MTHPAKFTFIEPSGDLSQCRIQMEEMVDDIRQQMIDDIGIDAYNYLMFHARLVTSEEKEPDGTTRLVARWEFDS